MSVRGPINVGRAVQTDPTLLRYASAITEQKKCWELLAEKFCRFQTLRNNTQQHATTSNNMQQGVQTDATCNIPNNVGSSWSTMLRPFARSLRPEKKKLSLGRLLILHVLVVNKPSPPARITGVRYDTPNRVQNQGDVFQAVSNFSLVKIPLVSVTKCVHRSPK